MISIIIPIFNVEKYLPKCLNSIAGQTLKDWEALLIDDGSTDNSGEICDFICRTDPRFRVIHQNNAGLSDARNTGLRNAIGDYICFIDGDDYIHPRFLEIMYGAIIEYKADMVSSHVKSVSYDDVSDEAAFDNLDIKINTKQFSQHELFSSLFYIHKKFHSVAVWNKLFRKEIIKDIFFENTTCEDLEFLSRVYHRVRKGIRLNVQLYFYLKRPGSITSDGFSMRNRGEIDTFLRVLNNLNSSQKLERGYCLQQLYILLPRLWQISKNSVYQRETRAICRNTMKKTLSELLRNKKIPFWKKIGLLTFNLFPFSYDVFVKFRVNRQVNCL